MTKYFEQVLRVLPVVKDDDDGGGGGGGAAAGVLDTIITIISGG